MSKIPAVVAKKEEVRLLRGCESLHHSKRRGKVGFFNYVVARQIESLFGDLLN